MNVDIAALRSIEREKEISFDTVVEAIETALLTAYKHTEGPHPAQAMEGFGRLFLGQLWEVYGPSLAGSRG